ATVVTLVWGLRERPMLLVVAWSALRVASLLGFAAIPASLSSAGPDERAATDRDTALARERRRLEGLAFGLTALTDSAPPGFPDLDAATTAVPIWDAERVLAKAATRRDLVRSPGTPAAAGLSPHSFGAGRSTWIVALRPDRDSAALQQPPPGWAAVHRGPLAGARPRGNPAGGVVAANRPRLGSPKPRAGPPRDRRPRAVVATGRSGAPRAARTVRLVRRRRTRGGRQRPVVGGVRLLRRGRVSAGPSGGRGRGRFAAL